MRNLSADTLRTDLDTFTREEIEKRIRQTSDIEVLNACWNECQARIRWMGVTDARLGHLTRHDLDRLAVESDRRNREMVRLQTKGLHEKNRCRYAPNLTDPLSALSPSKEHTDDRNFAHPTNLRTSDPNRRGHRSARRALDAETE